MNVGMDNKHRIIIPLTVGNISATEMLFCTLYLLNCARRLSAFIRFDTLCLYYRRSALSILSFIEIIFFCLYCCCTVCCMCLMVCLVASDARIQWINSSNNDDWVSIRNEPIFKWFENCNFGKCAYSFCFFFLQIGTTHIQAILYHSHTELYTIENS